MKTFNLLILLLIFAFSSVKINSQTYNPYGFTCDEVPDPPEMSFPLIGGQYKPESISRYTTNPSAVFPVLILFVQFQNDSGPDVGYWMSGRNPTFYKNIIATNKASGYGSNWWNAYNEDNATLSDFWMETSRGDFHITGKSFSIILPHDNGWYKTNYGTNSVYKINDDFYNILQSNYQDSIYWPDFDKWSGSSGNFTYGDGDGYVDMIYKVFRSHSPGLGLPAGGIAFLYDSYQYGSNYPIYINGNDTIWINGGFGSIGSGLTMTPGHGGDEGTASYIRYAPMNKTGTISFSEHEHGHYLFGGGHMRYGKMCGAGADYGVDEWLSPYESLLMGYMKSRPVDFGTVNYSIGDYSSRNSNDTGEVLEVPINGSNEFFLIANRTKVSNYDRVMWGDTCHGDPYRTVNPDYGKGLYIYHADPGNSGYPYESNMDMECADGLFNWEFLGYEHPDWSTTQNVDYYGRTSVSYNNDDGGDYYYLANHDGKSIFTWFSIGKKNTTLYGDGTDRVFTNDSEVWTSREWQGDRWDAWRVGYNEVFSPYSSPSTKNWSNGNTGIFIYLDSTYGSTADIKIYRTRYGGYNESQILAATPPSRPVGLELTFSDCEDSICNPILTWNHNTEPDMISSSLKGDFETYKIYRVSTDNLSELPDENNYECIATISVNVNNTPTYRDYDTQLQCGQDGDPEINYAVRYRVSAVDITSWESVKSDFVSDLVSKVYSEGGDFFTWNANTPKVFSLSQNYPNPFNPTTEIKYSIPSNGVVTLKVYNILGAEVATLINGYEQAGKYVVSFDGSNLASGVYFYKLKIGAYVSTKKMVLIK